MANPLAELRRLVAPAARRRTATVAALLPGGQVELAGANGSTGPVVYCGVAVVVGDRVLVEADRVLARLTREATKIVTIR